MDITQTVHCPNCGKKAQRHYLKCSINNISKIECPSCDYLMVTCVDTGRVLEAYAPGLVMNTDHSHFKSYGNSVFANTKYSPLAISSLQT